MRKFFLHKWRELSQRVREQSRPTLSWTLRLTVAATAAYIVATLFFNNQPLLAPLSALLVTQVTLRSVVRHGIERVVSVVAGVLIATLFASIAGLTWWSLAISTALALLIGQILRLGDHVIEVPVSALFVMAVQAVPTASFDRIMSTLIGAAVGFLVNFLVPPGERSLTAAAAVRQYGEDTAHTIRSATAQMDSTITTEQAQAWLDSARALDYKTIHIDRLIDHAAEVRALNVRAINTPNATRALRTGLYALEHSAVAIRGVFRGISDVVHYPSEGVEDPLPEEPRAITRDVLDAIADVIEEFAGAVERRVYAPMVASADALLNALERLKLQRERANDRENSKLDVFEVRELLAILVVFSGRIMREFDPRGHTWVTVDPAPIEEPRTKAMEAAKRLKKQLRRRS